MARPVSAPSALPVPAEGLGPGLSDEAIAAGERRLRVRLPEAYARLLARANGYRLRDAVVRPSGDGPALDVRTLAGIRGPGAGVAPEDLVGYNAYFTAAIGARPKQSIAFAHGRSGSFVLYHGGARAGRIGFVDRSSRAVTLVASSFEDFVARLEARAQVAIVHASSRRRAEGAEVAPIARPRRPRILERVDLGEASLPRGAAVTDVRAIECTFGGRVDAQGFTTFERIELVRPKVDARLLMNVVCRSVVVDGSKTGTKVLSLVNVLCDRVRLVGDHGRLFFRRDEEHLPKGAAELAATFYDSVPWALDIREARFRELTLRGIPGHLVLRDPARHAVVLTERLAKDGSFRRLEPGLVAVLEHALEHPDECHVLCASDFLPRGAAARARIAELRARGFAE